MTRLVVNADDLGLHPRLDEGIFAAHRDGLVTSTTVLATGPTAPAAIAAAAAQGLATGVHLCLTTHLGPAAPRAKVRWLAPGGRFRKNWAELVAAFGTRLIPLEEIDLEFRAQVARARELGARVDHLDTHQHLHLLPGVSGLVSRLAADEGLPLRWPKERPRLTWLRHPARAAKSALLAALSRLPQADGVLRVPAVGLFEAGSLTEERLVDLLERLGPGDVELGCHPGRDPGAIAEDPHWRYGWEAELTALCSDRARATVERLGISLCSYADLAEGAEGQFRSARA